MIYSGAYIDTKRVDRPGLDARVQAIVGLKVLSNTRQLTKRDRVRSACNSLRYSQFGPTVSALPRISVEGGQTS